MAKLRLVYLAVLLVIISPGLTSIVRLQAQTMSSSASLSGTVSDPSGARVPKATVKITDSEKGNTRATTAGTAGEFSFALPARGRLYA